MSPLIKQGSKRPITSHDLWPVNTDGEAREIHRLFKTLMAHSHLSTAIRKLVYRPILLNLLLTFIYAALQLTIPFFMHQILKLLEEDKEVENGDFDVKMGYVYAAGLFVIPLVSSFIETYTRVLRTKFCSKVYVAIVNFLYRKTLHLSLASRQNYNVGEMVNLMAIDAAKIEALVFRFGGFFLLEV